MIYKTTLTLGTDLDTGEPISVPLDWFFSAEKPMVSIMGVPGSGKSSLKRVILANLLRYGEANVISMPAKYEDFVTERALFADLTSPRRTVVVDPTDPDYVVPLGLFEPPRGVPAEVWAEKVVEIMDIGFGENEQGAYRPVVEDSWSSVAVALMNKGLTPLEVFDFLSSDTTFRDTVLNDQGRMVRRGFDELDDLPKSERAKRILPVQTRGKKFWQPGLRAMLASPKCGIPYDDLAKRERHILVNAARSSMLSEQCAKFLASTIVYQIIETSQVQQRSPRRPCFLILDEWHRLASPTFAEALLLLRSARIFCILINQDFEQLRSTRWPSPDVLVHALRASCGIRICFSLLREDAEITARDLWSGEVNGDEIKEEIWQTKFRPVSKYVPTISITKNKGKTKTKGTIEHETRGKSTSKSEGESFQSDIPAGSSDPYPFRDKPG